MSQMLRANSGLWSSRRRNRWRCSRFSRDGMGSSGDGKTDIAARGFVAARRVANESRELDQGEILGPRLLVQGSDDAATTECATGCAASEHFRCFEDSRSTDAPETVAMVEVQRTPPSKASTRSQTQTKRPMEPSARSARSDSRDLMGFMGLNRPGFRGTDDTVQRSATEVNRKVMGAFGQGKREAKGETHGEGEGEGKRGGSPSPSETREEDWKAPQNPFC